VKLAYSDVNGDNMSFNLRGNMFRTCLYVQISVLKQEYCNYVQCNIKSSVFVDYTLFF